MTMGKNYLITMFIISMLFVGVLFYSYLFKLGYLKIATYLLIFAVIVILTVNSSIKKLDFRARLFWIALLFGFVYALADKYYKLHVKFAVYLLGLISLNPVIAVNIIYIVFFLFVVVCFHKFLISEFKERPEWTTIFTLAIFLKITAIFSDLVFHDITEDYFELFSLYFFLAAFILALKKNRNNY